MCVDYGCSVKCEMFEKRKLRKGVGVLWKDCCNENRHEEELAGFAVKENYIDSKKINDIILEVGHTKG